MEPITIELSSPIEHDGKTITSLTFREAEVGDAMAMDAVKGEMAKSAALLACMCGLSLPVMKKIKFRDMNRIMGAVAALMGNVDTPTENGSTSES